LKNRFLNYGRQLLDEDDIESIFNILKSDYLTQGPAVELFEQDLCNYTGAKYAVAVSSGTAALHVSCLAAGLESNDIGITSTLTFVATANAFLFCGGNANVIDIDPYTLSLSTEALSVFCNEKRDTKAVIPVHYGGLACNEKKIRKIANSASIIEDASHSLGGRYENGDLVGSCVEADMSVFSFHPVKPITTGEGGAILTNDAHLYQRLKKYANHGIERNINLWADSDQTNPWYYEQQELGFNYRMSDIHAALGHAQLKKLDHFVARRRKIAEIYDEAFSKISAISLPQSESIDRARSAHHLYVIEVDFDELGLSRNYFAAEMKKSSVGGQIHYIPVHRQPYYQKRYNYDKSRFPVAESYYSKCLSLPIHAGLTDSEIKHVISVIIRIIENQDKD